MAKKRKEIITIKIPNVKNGDFFTYVLKDKDFNDPTFRFSAQNDDSDNKVSISVIDDSNLDVVIHNADASKFIETPLMTVTDERQPIQLYLQIALTDTDNNGCRKWIVQFSKK